MSHDLAHDPFPIRQAEGLRRDFLYLTTAAMGAVGAGIAVWPLIASMNPAADVRALSSTEVDLGPIELGQRISIIWRGNPVFIEHRTPETIALARADDQDPNLIDPASDAERVTRADWLIVVGVCTHLGCIPLGQKRGVNGMAGFAPATAPTTTDPAGSAKGPHQKTSSSPPTGSPKPNAS